MKRGGGGSAICSSARAVCWSCSAGRRRSLRLLGDDDVARALHRLAHEQRAQVRPEQRERERRLHHPRLLVLERPHQRPPGIGVGEHHELGAGVLDERPHLLVWRVRELPHVEHDRVRLPRGGVAAELVDRVAAIDDLHSVECGGVLLELGGVLLSEQGDLQHRGVSPGWGRDARRRCPAGRFTAFARSSPANASVAGRGYFSSLSSARPRRERRRIRRRGSSRERRPVRSVRRSTSSWVESSSGAGEQQAGGDRHQREVELEAAALDAEPLLRVDLRDRDALGDEHRDRREPGADAEQRAQADEHLGDAGRERERLGGRDPHVLEELGVLLLALSSELDRTVVEHRAPEREAGRQQREILRRFDELHGAFSASGLSFRSTSARGAGRSIVRPCRVASGAPRRPLAHPRSARRRRRLELDQPGPLLFAALLVARSGAPRRAFPCARSRRRRARPRSGSAPCRGGPPPASSPSSRRGSPSRRASACRRT